MKRNRGYPKNSTDQQPLPADVPKVSKAGHPNMQPDEFFMCSINFGASRRRQQLHAQVRGAEQKSTEQINNHMETCTDVFRLAAIALVDVVDIFIRAPFRLEHDCTREIDQEDHYRGYAASLHKNISP